MGIYLFIRSTKQSIAPTPSSNPILFSLAPSFVPVPISSEGPQPGRSYTYSSTQDELLRNQGEKVAQLIKKLPYTGGNFTFNYNFDTNKFTLTLKKGQETAGNLEFNNFLKANQIQDRSWITNLIIKSQ